MKFENRREEELLGLIVLINNWPEMLAVYFFANSTVDIVNTYNEYQGFGQIYHE